MHTAKWLSICGLECPSETCTLGWLQNIARRRTEMIDKGEGCLLSLVPSVSRPEGQRCACDREFCKGGINY